MGGLTIRGQLFSFTLRALLFPVSDDEEEQVESLIDFLGSDLAEIMPEEVCKPSTPGSSVRVKVTLLVDDLAVLEAELSPCDALFHWAISFPVLNQKFPSSRRLGRGKWSCSCMNTYWA